MKRDLKQTRRAERAEFMRWLLKCRQDEMSKSANNAEIYPDGWAADCALPSSAECETRIFFLHDNLSGSIRDCTRETDRFGIESRVDFKPGKIAIVNKTSRFFEKTDQDFYDGVLNTNELELSIDSALLPVLACLKDKYYPKDPSLSEYALGSSKAIYIPEMPCYIYSYEKVKKCDGRSSMELVDEEMFLDVIVYMPPERKAPLVKGWQPEDIIQCMRGRIDTVMKIAMEHNVDTLALSPPGASGSGWEITEASCLLRDWLVANGKHCTISNIVVSWRGIEFETILSCFEEDLWMMAQGLANYRGHIDTSTEILTQPQRYQWKLWESISAK